MRSEIVQVSPARAAQLLAANSANRPITKSSVDFLVKEIKAGRWQVNNDAIAVAETGRLLNGQHRLSAIVKAGTTVPVLMLFDVAESSFETMDRGRGRSLAEAAMLPRSLVSDVSVLHAAAIGTNKLKLAPSEIADLVEAWRPTWEVFAQHGGGERRTRMNTASLRIGAGLRWAIAQTDEERDYITNGFSLIIKNEVANSGVALATLWQRLTSAGLTAGRSMQISTALKVFVHFDPKSRNVKTYVRDEQATRKQVVGLVSGLVDAFLRGSSTSANGGHPYNWTSPGSTSTTRRSSPRNEGSFALVSPR